MSDSIPVGAPTSIMLAQITPNMKQPRRNFDGAPMLELAQSIRAAGLVQPIVLQPGDDYHGAGLFDYTIVAGERRWRASCALAVAQHRAPGDDDMLQNLINAMCGNVFGFLDRHRPLLEQTPIAAIITEKSEGNRLLLKATIENLHRTDLNDIELANAYQQLAKDGMSDSDIASAVGKSRSTVANTRRLTNLPNDMQHAVISGVISTSVALAYLPALDVKSHLVGEAGLNDQPNFPYSSIPTPAALRKRLCNPEKYGVKLNRDDVRRLVEQIIDRCNNPAPCVGCGMNTKTDIYNRKIIAGEYWCLQCRKKKLADEKHTRWCPNCRKEQQLNGLEIIAYNSVKCNECGKGFSGHDWRKDPPLDHSKIEYEPLVLEEPSPPIEATGIIAVTVYCPECGTSRVMEKSRIDKGLRSNCSNCRAVTPGDEWLKEKPVIETKLCTCGAKLLPNDIRLGYTKCRACELETDQPPENLPAWIDDVDAPEQMTPLQAAGLAINGKQTDQYGYQTPGPAADHQPTPGECPACGHRANIDNSDNDAQQCPKCKSINSASLWISEAAQPVGAKTNGYQLKQRLDEKLGKYAVYACHVCGQKTIVINAEANTVACEDCGNAWDTIADYHAERAYYEQNNPIESADMNGLDKLIYNRFLSIIRRASAEQLHELDAWLDDLEAELMTSKETA